MIEKVLVCRVRLRSNF